MKRIAFVLILIIGVISVVISCKKEKEETVKETIIS